MQRDTQIIATWLFQKLDNIYFTHDKNNNSDLGDFLTTTHIRCIEVLQRRYRWCRDRRNIERWLPNQQLSSSLSTSVNNASSKTTKWDASTLLINR